MAPSGSSRNYSLSLNRKRSYTFYMDPQLEFIKISKTTLFQVFTILVSAIFYLAGIGSDLYLAFDFYYEGRISYFCLTLFFVFLPGIIIAFLYHKMYLTNPESVMFVKSKRKRLVWFVLTVLQLELFRMYGLAMFYGIASIVSRWKSKKDENMETMAVQFDKDTLDMEEALISLRLIEAFTEAATQVMLQFYIVISDGPENVEILQLCSIATSLLGLAWSVTFYHKFKIQPTTISWLGCILLYFGYLCTISARVSALSAYGHVFPLPVVGICVLHWLMMMSWFKMDKTIPHKTTLEKICFAWIYLFVFVNDASEDDASWRKKKYYIIDVVYILEALIFYSIWVNDFSTESQYRSEELSSRIWKKKYQFIFKNAVIYIFGIVLVGIITESCFVNRKKRN